MKSIFAYHHHMVKQSTRPGNLAFKFVTFLDFGTSFSSATCYVCALPGWISQLAVFLARVWNENVDSKQMGMFLQQLNRNTQKMRILVPPLPLPNKVSYHLLLTKAYSSADHIKLSIWWRSEFMYYQGPLWSAGEPLGWQSLIARKAALREEQSDLCSGTPSTLVLHTKGRKNKTTRTKISETENDFLDGWYLISIQSILFCIEAAKQSHPPGLGVSKHRQLVSPWISPLHWPCTGNPSLLYP